MQKILSIFLVGGTVGIAVYLFMFSSLFAGFPVSNPQAAASTAPEAAMSTDAQGKVTSTLLISAEHGGTLLNRGDAHAYLKVNPGALKEDYTFSMFWNGNPSLPTNLKSHGRIYTIKATDSSNKNVSDLGGRVSVCITYDANTLGSVVKEALNIYHNDGKGWVMLSNRFLNATDHVVCGDTTSLSDFGVFSSIAGSTPNVGGTN